MGIGKIETRDKGWGDGLMAGGEAIAAGEKIAPDLGWEKMVEKKIKKLLSTCCALMKEIELLLIRKNLISHYTPLGAAAKVTEVMSNQFFNSRTMLGKFRTLYKTFSDKFKKHSRKLSLATAIDKSKRSALIENQIAKKRTELESVIAKMMAVEVVDGLEQFEILLDPQLSQTLFKKMRIIEAATENPSTPIPKRRAIATVLASPNTSTRPLSSNSQPPTSQPSPKTIMLHEQQLMLQRMLSNLTGMSPSATRKTGDFGYKERLEHDNKS
ncbi:hypothetical protein DAPPUDRAFT_110837 [Daphnia pulex]|uniref:Uncharacterized protein n=1 Tax=Daphnia pulex TaxID=6669 RepID=E9H7A8_DAPPU|nr:hypothetical protein DAPPUDRAFT_110837 [Daphnia pulex]|eukprot:EFX72400.1 hypothetical protein DAPPUDRAFT_110837 [Daphnia pulex]